MGDEPIAALILAAGQSSRLGRPKQLVLLDGETLLHRIVRLALEAGCSPVVVVLGADEDACRQVLVDLARVGTEARIDLHILVNEDWRTGMSTSLRAGLAAIGGPHSVLVLVSDQVRLTADSLRRLLSKHRAAQVPLTSARYHGKLGVPAIFAPALHPELAAITGDKGARELLATWGDRAAIVDLPEAAADLDTPADLDAFIQKP
jgi:molybdenum cofactor cytidylyltransferase